MKDTLVMAVRNIGKRKKRAALTMVGVFIGIAAVVALVMLGQGLQSTLNAQFEKIGVDKLIVQAKEAGFTGEERPGQMTAHELDVVEKAHGVVERAGVLFRGAKVVFNDVQRTQFVMGLPAKKSEAELVIAFNLLEAEDGRLLTHKDKGKAVVGYNLGHTKLFKKDVAVGNKIEVEGEVFDVVGVLKRVGDPGIDGNVVISDEELRLLLDEPVAFTYIVAQSAQGENPEVVGERIEKALRRDRHLDEGKEDFSVQSSTELIESFNAVFNIVQFVFIGIAMISLIVGGIGIMNTMYTAVLERTREIGVMKAIGARNKDVLMIFLFESGLLGTVGGAIGILIGIGISKVIEFGANAAFGPGTIIVGIPLWLIVGTLAFSFVVGTVSGVMPARRASRLNPVDALRSE